MAPTPRIDPAGKMRRTAMVLCWAGSSKSLISSDYIKHQKIAPLTLYG